MRPPLTTLLTNPSASCFTWQEGSEPWFPGDFHSCVDLAIPSNTCERINGIFGQGFFNTPSSSHSFLNGIPSASEPLNGSVKLELPSLQDTETDPCSWLACPDTPPQEVVDMFIESPPITASAHSEPVSPRNNGLLEALIYQAQTTCGGVRNQPSEMSSSSSVVTPENTAELPTLYLQDIGLDENDNPLFPSGCFTASFFSEYAPIRGCSPDEFPPALLRLLEIMGQQPRIVRRPHRRGREKCHHSRISQGLMLCWIRIGLCKDLQSRRISPY